MIVPTWAGSPAGTAARSPSGTFARRASLQGGPGSPAAANSTLRAERDSAARSALAGSGANNGRLVKRPSWRAWASGKLAAAFYAHGQTISKHQVSTLLITCVVICSLFYPAVGIFLWSSKGGPGLSRGDASSVWQSMSTPLLDSLGSSERRHLSALRDLQMVWDVAPDLSAADVRDAALIFSKEAVELCFEGTRSGEGPSVKSGVQQQPLPLTGLPSLFSGLSNTAPPKRSACRSFRVEHLFITTDGIAAGQGSRYGALDPPIMQSALRLQSAIEDVLLAGRNITIDGNTVRLQCVRAVSDQSDAGGPCLSLSPLDYWSHSASDLAADDTPHQTLRHGEMIKNDRGVPISISTTLAGRWHLFKRFPRAQYLVMTFLLDADEGQARQQVASLAHQAWTAFLSELTQGQVAIIQSEATAAKELLLQFRPSGHRRWSVSHGLLGLGYVALIVYICRGIVRVKRIHSRYGLAFTAAVELAISVIMSVSICSLLGVRLAAIPWEIMPFVILVVGSENMFVLTDALTSTPLSLPVPARMAQGLATVGVPVTLTVISDMILMGTIARFTPVAAVREFCIFAMFLLVMDWFMQMTFFITILSIDMQRLELADMLTHGGRPAEEPTADIPATARHRHGKRLKRGTIAQLGARAVWRARTARTASLSLLLAAMFGLYVYYGSGQPHYQQIYSVDQPAITAAPTATAFNPLSHLAQADDAASSDSEWLSSPSADLWRALNPTGTAYIRMIVEPWTILSLRSNNVQAAPLRGPIPGWSMLRPRARQIAWLVKIVVFPISATTALLWILLLYLLKDTELLELQRDHDVSLMPALWDGANGSARLDEAFDVHMQHSDVAGDIVKIVDAKEVLVLIDIMGCIAIRSADPADRSRTEWAKLSTRINGELRAQDDSVTAACIIEGLSTLLLGLRSGKMRVVRLRGGASLMRTRLAEPSHEVRSPVLHISVARSSPRGTSSPRFVAIVAHADGTVMERGLGSDSSVLIAAACGVGNSSIVPLSTTSAATSAIRDASDSSTMIAVSSPAGLDLWMHSPASGRCIKALECAMDAYQRVRCVALVQRPKPATTPPANQDSREPGTDLPYLQMALLGTSAGTLNLIDAQTGSTLQELDIGDGPIFKLLCPPVYSFEDDAVQIAALTRSRVWFLRLSLKLPALPSPTASLDGMQLAHAPRPSNGDAEMQGTPTRPRLSNTNGSSGTALESYFAGTPGGKDASPTRASIDPSYPMSTHGSRNRRSSAYNVRSERSNGALDKEADQTLRVVGVTSCLRGSADVVGPWVIGVRRGVQLPGDAESGSSFSAAAASSRSRWQVFALDLQQPVTLHRGQARVASTTLSLEDSGIPEDAEADFSSTAAVALAVSEIRLAQSSADKRSLFFGFGNVLGQVQFSATPAK